MNSTKECLASLSAKANLTPRETEILRAVTREGLSDGEISEKFFISKHTVHRHLSSIYGKLGVKSRHKAVIVASQTGLLD